MEDNEYKYFFDDAEGGHSNADDGKSSTDVAESRADDGKSSIDVGEPSTDASVGRAKNRAPRNSLDVKRLVGIAMFGALAYGVTFVFRIPVSFLTFDAKDAVLAIAAFIYGPVAAIVMSFIPAFIEFITISDTGIWGFIMNFASSAMFSATAALIYKLKRSFNGAIIAVYSAVAVTTLLMMPMNLLITPLYTGFPISAIADIIPTLLLPFNFAKALLNGAFVMLLYKPISLAMKRAGLIKGDIDMRFTRRSVIMVVVGVITLVAAAVIFFILRRA